MSDLILNLRIGKLHIKISRERSIRFSLNPYQRWLKWPFVQIH